MRHGKKFNHLGRTSSHRKALLSNLASALIMNKRVTTTLAKGRELRKYVEPLLTKAKSDSTHTRRVVFSYLQNKESVHELFGDVAEKIATRPGGYTRIIKTGTRLGDNSEMCLIELVDYNEIYSRGIKGAAKAKTRRSRRKGGKAEGETTLKADAKVPSAKAEESKPQSTNNEDSSSEETK